PRWCRFMGVVRHRRPCGWHGSNMRVLSCSAHAPFTERGLSGSHVNRTKEIPMKTKTFALALAGGTLLAALPAAAIADDDDDRDGDVRRSGNYVVKKGQEIDGNLTVRNGNVVIRGEVDGNIRQIGRGSVVVAPSGSVDGNIVERGKGGISVRGDVDGNVTELHRGSVKILRSADIDGNVYE